MTSPSGPRKHTKRSSGKPGPIAIATIGASVGMCNAVELGTRRVEIADEQGRAPDAERVGRTERRDPVVRHAETDEDEADLAAARRRQHDLVHAHRAVDPAGAHASAVSDANRARSSNPSAR